MAADSGGGGFGLGQGKSALGGLDGMFDTSGLNYDPANDIAKINALSSQIPIGGIQAPVQSTPISQVTNPLLDQLITHFGPGPEKAEGQLGALLESKGL